MVTPVAKWNPSRDCWESLTDPIDLLSGRPAVFRETWPSSVIVSQGLLYKRPMPAPRMVASAYSSSRLPTPVAGDAKNAARHTTRATGMHPGTTLVDATREMMPTPQAHDAIRGKTAEQVAAMRARGHGVANLNELAENELLPTPRSADDDAGPWVPHGTGPNLSGAIGLLPTPTQALAEGGQTSRSGDRADEPLLPTIALDLLPTPVASENDQSRSNKGGNPTLAGAIHGYDPKTAERMGRMVLPLADASEATMPNSASGPRRTGRSRRDSGHEGIVPLLELPPEDSTDSTLLPTPLTSDVVNEAPADGRRESPQLRATSLLFPTPVAAEHQGNPNQGSERKGSTGQVWLTNVGRDLAEMNGLPVPTTENSQLLPTPAARDFKDSPGITPHPEKRKLAHTVKGEISLLPTPSAAMPNDGESAETWQARHDRHASKAENPTRSGMPLSVAVQSTGDPMPRRSVDGKPSSDAKRRPRRRRPGATGRTDSPPSSSNG